MGRTAFNIRDKWKSVGTSKKRTKMWLFEESL